MKHVQRDLQHFKRDMEYVKIDLELVKRDAKHIKRDMEHVKRDMCVGLFGHVAVEKYDTCQRRHEICQKRPAKISFALDECVSGLFWHIHVSFDIIYVSFDMLHL